MTKGKTKRGMTKRVVTTNSGQLKRKRATRRHLLQKRSARKKGNLRRSVIVSSQDSRNVRQMVNA